MIKKQLEFIQDKPLETAKLNEKEMELALKILNNLEGTLVIRANSILTFCLKAIQYSVVN